ncbi:MAG: EAL domain-containing protein [Micavibrio aeruginosavorus]|nr:EAL domain-containing protein [Micavibrio aeruginosavorus]
MQNSGPGPAKIHATALLSLLRQTMPAQDDDMARFTAALADGRFFFERETWHDLHGDGTGRAIGEMLLRAQDETGRALSQESAIRGIGAAGLNALLDTALVLAALEQAIAQDEFPVSVNVSAQQAGDPVFWNSLEGHITQYFGARLKSADVIFEFTEDDAAENPAHATLMALRDKGYRFAIDDLSHHAMEGLALLDDPAAGSQGESPAAAEGRRLRNLAPYADFIKLDGKSVLAAERGDFAIDDFLLMIRKETGRPDVAILAEWVDSLGQAVRLRDEFNVRYVSGRALPHDADTFARFLPKPQ